MNSSAVFAKKGTGLGDLFKDYAPQQLEEQKEIMVECGNSDLQEAREEYKRTLPNWGSSLYRELSPIVLSPSDINVFLQQTIEYDRHHSYKRFTSHFIDHLLHHSFNAGHRSFYLNVQNIPPLNFLGSGLFREAKKLSTNINPSTNITIDGDIGDNFGPSGFLVHYILRGNTGSSPFNNFIESTAIIKGKINHQDAHAFWGASHSTFFIHEYDGIIPRITQNCTFKTDDEKTFRSMRKNNEGKNNKIYLVDEHDREVILKE